MIQYAETTTALVVTHEDQRRRVVWHGGPEVALETVDPMAPADADRWQEFDIASKGEWWSHGRPELEDVQEFMHDLLTDPDYTDRWSW